MFWAALGAAFALGATHALEVDHMVAVTTFVGRRPRLVPAIGYGLRWGFGHGLVVLAAGGALSLSGLRLPASATRWVELGIGLTLMTLGTWAVRGAARLHVHTPGAPDGHEGRHVHLHAHPPADHPHRHPAHGASGAGDPADRRRHRHLSTFIGAAHGLAGTGPIVALIPVTILERPAAAVGYLATFGAGTMLAMGSYAGLAALAVGQSARSERSARWAARITGLMSMAVGLWWVGRALLQSSR